MDSDYYDSSDEDLASEPIDDDDEPVIVQAKACIEEYESRTIEKMNENRESEEERLTHDDVNFLSSGLFTYDLHKIRLPPWIVYSVANEFGELVEEAVGETMRDEENDTPVDQDDEHIEKLKSVEDLYYAIQGTLQYLADNKDSIMRKEEELTQAHPNSNKAYRARDSIRFLQDERIESLQFLEKLVNQFNEIKNW